MPDRPLPDDVYAATVEAMARVLQQEHGYNRGRHAVIEALDAALAGPLGDWVRDLRRQWEDAETKVRELRAEIAHWQREVDWQTSPLIEQLDMHRHLVERLRGINEDQRQTNASAFAHNQAEFDTLRAQRDKLAALLQAVLPFAEQAKVTLTWGPAQQSISKAVRAALAVVDDEGYEVTHEAPSERGRDRESTPRRVERPDPTRRIKENDEPQVDLEPMTESEFDEAWERGTPAEVEVNPDL